MKTTPKPKDRVFRPKYFRRNQPSSFTVHPAGNVTVRRSDGIKVDMVPAQTVEFFEALVKGGTWEELI